MHGQMKNAIEHFSLIEMVDYKDMQKDIKTLGWFWGLIHMMMKANPRMTTSTMAFNSTSLGIDINASSSSHSHSLVDHLVSSQLVQPVSAKVSR
jgi:hypothetical protein